MFENPGSRPLEVPPFDPEILGADISLTPKLSDGFLLGDGISNPGIPILQREKEIESVDRKNEARHRRRSSNYSSYVMKSDTALSAKLTPRRKPRSVRQGEQTLKL